MSRIPDERLYTYSDRVKDKVVVITGAAGGIGKESTIQFASHGAKVVVGDIDKVRGEEVVSQIAAAGGTATFLKCNVTVWDDQVALFEHAITTYGSVDVVVVNAGIGESPVGGFGTVNFKNGKPVPPSLLTLEVDLIGSCYTAHLAQHYLLIGHVEGSLKSLVLVGSMASWIRLPLGELYTTSKHGLLGLMRASYERLELSGIRVACIHPWFADTGILPLSAKAALAGFPLTSVPRIGGTIFYAATDPDPSTNGSAWLLADDGPAVVVVKEEFKLGVYALLDERVNAFTTGVKGVGYAVRLGRDIWRLFGKPFLKYGSVALVVGLVWSHRQGDSITSLISSLRR